jgi:calcineurin-like phosphoesterase family protein
MVLVDSNGIAWFVATGQQGVISQSRDESADDRWSGNVTGVSRGYETTMIARSHGTNSSSHFASKLFGGNHSGSGASSQRWYDLGIRVDGEVQLQWEGPHPSNHSFTLPASKQPISNIGVGLENNWIGLKWVVYKVVAGGSPANGGVRCIMWVNTSIAADGRPNNANWRLCLDFIDGVDVEVIDPQTFQAPDECDLEIRRSDTDSHDIYAGGHHWRKLSAADITAFNNGGTTNPPPPPPPPNQPGNIDQFGIKMIYPTKEDGATWFQDNNPEGDGRLISDAEIITRIGDYFVASPEPEGDVYIKVVNEFEPFIECNVNYSQLASQGFVSSDGDWKNVEVTIFIYPQEIEAAATASKQFAIEARASDDDGNENCCSDHLYAATLILDPSGTLAGQVRLTKRLSVQNRLDNITQTVKPNFYRSWTGMKLCIYNVNGPNNETWVTVELWLCPSDSTTDKTTNWTKVYSFIDKGNNWGVGGDACGGDVAQAITWGAPFVAMRYINEPEIRWKHWSVREIDINGEFPTDPTDPPTDPPCEEEDPTTPPPPPPPATASLNRFISWGDNDTTTDATDVLDRIFLETNVAQYLFAGDGPYSNSGTAWVNMMSEYFNTTDLKNKLMLAQGNHEHPESESQQAENDIEAWFPSLNNPDDNLDWLAAKKVGNAYVIVMNSQDPQLTTIGGDQYNFVQTELTKAKNLRSAGQIDWIITMVHKSWFNLLGSNPSYVQARHTYAAMFNDAQVDFMFHGHNHSYAIWRPVVAIAGDNENTSAQQLFTMASDSTTYDLSKPHGAFYIINGNGGHEINSWGEDPADFPNVIYANDEVFGYTVLDIQGKQAKITAKNVSGATLFTVNATRGTDTAGNPLPPGDDDDDEPCTPPPPPPPPPPESIYNDLVIVYNINSDSDGCICNDPGFTPPEACPEGQHRNASGTCVDDEVVEPPDPDPPGSTTAIYNVRHDGSSPKDYKLGDDNSTSFYKKFGTEILGSDAPLYDVDIKRIEWPMRKSGNPTGDATIVIRRGSDNSIAKTLGTINVQDLTTSFDYKAVENTTSSYTTVVGDRIMIEYTGGDDNDYIIVRTTAEQQNDMKTVHQRVNQDDDEYSNTDTEACFIGYA